MRGGWRCAGREGGRPCVTTGGTTPAPLLSASSWASTAQVRAVSAHTCMHVHTCVRTGLMITAGHKIQTIKILSKLTNTRPTKITNFR